MSKPYYPDRPIFSGKGSEGLWFRINEVKGSNLWETLYGLGCKCQELESLLDRALERIEHLESLARKQETGGA